MATAPKTDAEKITKLREMAKDKSLPQEVRNTYLDQAVKMEEKAAKGAGVKLAKGGMPMRGERTATNKAKKMMYGGMADKPMMAKGGAVKAAPKKMMMGGAVQMTAEQQKASLGQALQAAPAPTSSPMSMQKALPKPIQSRGVTRRVARALPMRGQPTATNMAKGGAVKAKKK